MHWYISVEQLLSWYNALLQVDSRTAIQDVRGKIEDILRYVSDDNLNGWKTSVEQMKEWQTLLESCRHIPQAEKVLDEMNDILNQLRVKGDIES